jgi:hypothetical protein
MRKTFLGAFLFVLMAMTATSALAQDERYKFEFYGGYSYMNLNRGFDADEFNDEFGDFPGNRVNAHGIELGVNYNCRRFWVQSSCTRAMPQSGLSADGFKLEQKVGQFMGGIQIKDNKKDGPKLKPFAHILAGAAQQSFQGEGVPFIATPTSYRRRGDRVRYKLTDFAMSFGGGLDLRFTGMSIYGLFSSIGIRSSEETATPNLERFRVSCRTI